MVVVKSGEDSEDGGYSCLYGDMGIFLDLFQCCLSHSTYGFRT